MDEIKAFIKQKAEKLYNEKRALQNLRKTKILKLGNEIKDIIREQHMTSNNEDSFYQYLETQKSAKKQELSELVQRVLQEAKLFEKSFPAEKEIIIDYLNQKLNDNATPEDTRFKISEMISDINENFTIDNIENFYISFGLEKSIVPQEDSSKIKDSVSSNDPSTVANATMDVPSHDSVMANMATEETNNKIMEGVNIFFNAKNNLYILENAYTKEQQIIKRTDLKTLDKSFISEQTGKSIHDLTYIHTDILQLLKLYDKKNLSNTADIYFNLVSEIHKSKEDLHRELKDAHINIEYDLTGLYDTPTITDTEALLKIVNNSKRMGIATVKKGLKVAIIESIKKMALSLQLLNPFSYNKKMKLLEAAKQTRQIEYDKFEAELTQNLQLIDEIKEEEKQRKVEEEKRKLAMEQLDYLKLQKDLKDLMPCSSDPDIGIQFAIELQKINNEYPDSKPDSELNSEDEERD